MTWKTVRSIGYSSTTKFVQMMILGWPVDLFYDKVKFGLYAFVWEKVKIMEFSETIVVYDIKLVDQSTKWVHESLWISKVMVIHWTSSKVTPI